MGTPFPLIDARGRPRDLGRQHGKPCREPLRQLLDYLATCAV
jgi:hypothetical protein